MIVNMLLCAPHTCMAVKTANNLEEEKKNTKDYCRSNMLFLRSLQILYRTCMAGSCLCESEAKETEKERKQQQKNG